MVARAPIAVEEHYTVKELSKLLKCSERFIYELIWGGVLESVNIAQAGKPRVVRIPASAWGNYLDGKKGI